MARTLFGDLSPPKSDALVELGVMMRADPREGLIDLGIGVYRDEQGRSVALRSVAAAEARLAKLGGSKAYLPPDGDPEFTTRFFETFFPDLGFESPLIALAQAPGGTGALRLGLETIKRTGRNPTVWVGTPTWPNHLPLLDAVGLPVKTYRHYDPKSGEVDFDAVKAALSQIQAGDIVLLHGACHNPTGASFNETQWQDLGLLIGTRQGIPLVDFAYAGFAHGLQADIKPISNLVSLCPEVLIALSGSKTFGLYRERVGLLAIACSDEKAVLAVRGALVAQARILWSNPPAHGAAVVRTILSDNSLLSTWRMELETMRTRIRHVRQKVADRAPKSLRLKRVERQDGLFALLPLTPDQIGRFRSERGIYLPGDGRVNLAGLNNGNLDRFIRALESVAPPSGARC